MLTTLPQKAQPAHTALILVDVLNAFCAEGGAMHREGRDLSLVKPMIPRLHKLDSGGAGGERQARLDPVRVQHRAKSLSLRSLARAGQAPPQRSLHRFSGVRAGQMGSGFLRRPSVA